MELPLRCPVLMGLAIILKPPTGLAVTAVGNGSTVYVLK